MAAAISPRATMARPTQSPSENETVDCALPAGEPRAPASGVPLWWARGDRPRPHPPVSASRPPT
eukprot:11161766-Lingulodinium_polyedra.AAC.1